MINNRQNGRRRGRGGQQRVGGGNPGRPESGNRIDNRARGNASQLYEKYKALAGDAQRQGDRVNTEYYLQFADHYFRVLAESRPRADEQQARANGRNDFDEEFDGDGDEYGQEGEAAQPDQYQPRADDRYRQEGRQAQQEGRQLERQPQERHQERQSQDRPQDRQNQDDRPRQQMRQDGRPEERPRRDDRPRQDRQDARPDQPRAEQPRAEQPRAEQSRVDHYRDGQPRQEDRARQEDRPRQDRPRRDGAQDQRPRDDRYARVDRNPEQPVAVESPVEADAAPMMADERLTPTAPDAQQASTIRAADMDAPLPKRRGRPPKVRPEEALTAQPGPAAPEPSGFDADRLPPSLSVSASAEPDSGEPAEKPRRRRRIATGPAEAGSPS